MRTVKFGIIGCGLMGREFASAVARWCHLPEMDVKPEIVAVCDTNPEILKWYSENFDTVVQVTSEYKELLSNDDIDAVYVAVPHNLHQEFYCAAIEAGKHLLGEKPFGIDKASNDAIIDCINKHPDVFVRCSSESPFFPADHHWRLINPHPLCQSSFFAYFLPNGHTSTRRGAATWTHGRRRGPGRIRRVVISRGRSPRRGAPGCRPRPGR